LPAVVFKFLLKIVDNITIVNYSRKSTMGVASSLGLISGINYEELVSKLISLERNPITLLENRKTDLQGKVGALDTLSVKLASLKSAADTLSKEIA
jgi:flagellar capping protein FliD